MNVPVDARRRADVRRRHLGAGRYVEMRAEMDVLVLISNCPQLNNPCNGYNPTPVRLLVWHGRLSRAACSQGPHRQPRRDRLPHHPHAAAHGHRARSRSTPTPTRTRCTCGGRRGGRHRRRRPPPRATSTSTRSSRPRSARAPRRSTRATASWRERRLRRRAARRPGIAFIGPTPEQMRAFGLKHTARALAAKAGVPLLPGTGLLADVERGAARGRAHRLPGDAQEHGRRRRHRHAALRRRRRARRGVRRGRAPGASQLRAGRACSWRSSSTAPATSRCRSSATAQGSVRRARASATARCSGATRRSSRRRRRPGLPRRDARGAARRGACGWARAVDYRSAGTVEFVYDADARRVLLPRGQHAPPGRARRHRGGHRRRPRRVDGAARGGRARLPDARRRAPRGAADPGARLRRGSAARTSSPSAGLLTEVDVPRRTCASRRWVERGTEVTPFYDPLLAKIIVHGDDARRGAARALRDALGATPRSRASRPTCDYLRAALATPAFVAGRRPHAPARRRRRTPPQTIEVLDGGHADHRAGLPGPPRLLARRRAAVGPDGRAVVPARQPAGRQSADGAPGLECTLTGPDAALQRRGRRSRSPAPTWARRSTARRSPRWRAGRRSPRAACCALGAVRGAGLPRLPRRARRARRARCTSAAARPSRSAASAGTAAARCAPGDVLHLGEQPPAGAGAALPERADPAAHATTGRSRVLDGPHGAPDFFTDDDIDDVLRDRRGRCTTTRAAPACG